MVHIDQHLKWCLNDENRLKKVRPNISLALAHIKKSEYNKGVMDILEKAEKYDWALNVGFYSIYHCFLAIIAKYGYESRNQSCTITAILKLIEEKKMDFDKDLVMQFDTLDVDKEATNPTIRENREISTYGVKTEVNTEQFDKVKDLVIKIQRETIRIINE
ncbi:MAG: hypothetical protein KKF46_04940 [Nanoarchaeota archaeon]|nr:hypothetical protein [Nanoarchaeota archaeon]MBU1321679.1 hypothetical protein [Nanoarchaeota archaeon]MBU1598080.1 hypothetical protein [Nanoarchaeota archaeon]MBU2441628.1 hypothetical protein [Nanoarchaeota archaeon]